LFTIKVRTLTKLIIYLFFNSRIPGNYAIIYESEKLACSRRRMIAKSSSTAQLAIIYLSYLLEKVDSLCPHGNETENKFLSLTCADNGPLHIYNLSLTGVITSFKHQFVGIEKRKLISYLFMSKRKCFDNSKAADRSSHRLRYQIDEGKL